MYFLSFGVAGILGYLINFYVVSEIGYQGLFWIMGVLSVGSLVILSFFKEENIWAGSGLRAKLL